MPIPVGTIMVKYKSEERLYTVSDLQFTNDLSLGHLCNAVAHLYDKCSVEYGTKWPSLSDNKNTYKILNDKFKHIKNDYDKLVLVCHQLGEEVPPIVENSNIVLK